MCPRDREKAGKREPEAMNKALAGVLESLHIDLAAPSAEIGQHWERIVGPEVAKHCRPLGMKSGVLHAEVDSSVWCQDLQLRTPEILAALRKRMGKSAPTDLRLRVGYSRGPETERRPDQ